MIVTVDILRAAGLTDGQILRVVELAEQANAPSPGAERTRRWRERKASQTSHVTPNVTPSQSSQNALSSSSSLEGEVNKEKKQERAKKSGALLPADWQPNAQHLQEGRELGQSYAWVAEQAKDMRLWALANANRAVARKLDWNATFSGWIRRASKQARSPPRGRGDGYAGVLEELRNGQPDNTDDGQDADQARTIEHDADLFRSSGVAPGRR